MDFIQPSPSLPLLRPSPSPWYVGNWWRNTLLWHQSCSVKARPEHESSWLHKSFLQLSSASAKQEKTLDGSQEKFEQVQIWWERMRVAESAWESSQTRARVWTLVNSRSRLACGLNVQLQQNSPQIGVPVAMTAVHHCCGSVDVDAGAGVSVGGGVDDSRNAWAVTRSFHEEDLCRLATEENDCSIRDEEIRDLRKREGQLSRFTKSTGCTSRPRRTPM